MFTNLSLAENPQERK